ncbi:hypothetical protein ATC1_11329 [Flexilinea flocculi]|uniref:Uncharacterized protein n=1 Tax=Flexilinea flocculi TaxID=1678840 RepID=A0A0K8PA57_9CHLR|nr:hypothetical protein ATC1_11329 [Flexilinea flocculi]
MICHYEKGISPTKQSFLTCEEIASPLQGSSLQDSQVRNDKRRPYGARLVICHCEEGINPTKQSLFAWQSFFCVAGRLPRPCRARNDKYRYCRNDKRRHCTGNIPICHCEEGINPTKQSLFAWQSFFCVAGRLLRPCRARPYRTHKFAMTNVVHTGLALQSVITRRELARRRNLFSQVRRLLRPCRARPYRTHKFAMTNVVHTGLALQSVIARRELARRSNLYSHGNHSFVWRGDCHASVGLAMTNIATVAMTNADTVRDTYRSVIVWRASARRSNLFSHGNLFLIYKEIALPLQGSQ